jgi:hypothetical protein
VALMVNDLGVTDVEVSGTRGKERLPGFHICLL